jgi:hypothetical protein
MSVAATGRSVKGKSRTSSVCSTVWMGVVTSYNAIGQEEGCSVGIDEGMGDGFADGLVEGIWEDGPGDGCSDDTEDGFADNNVSITGDSDGAEVGEELVNGDGSEDGAEVGGWQYR